jgi:hypothetical protein
MASATLEVMACREGIALAEELQLHRIAVVSESDCLQVINSMKCSDEGSYCVVILKIKAKMPSFAGVIIFKHEHRASNSEAHLVARLFCVGRQVWLLQPPAGFFIPLNITLLVFKF